MNGSGYEKLTLTHANILPIYGETQSYNFEKKKGYSLEKKKTNPKGINHMACQKDSETEFLQSMIKNIYSQRKWMISRHLCSTKQRFKHTFYEKRF